eukprot:TRINITY_DN22320_c0_g1_i2.p2 TRINITY_DN22320_c0_g1~~TRINITY_DN22320_c0_g1_i2.p2  ORF type:complete len:138 (-),score=53.91 TRINITY_DN22320_c0_g1_i2:113-526(-)
MMGTVANESVPFVHGISAKPLNELAYIGIMELAFGLEVGTLAMMEYGPVPAALKADTRDFLAVIATDYIFYCPARNMATSYAKQVPTFQWYFDIAATFQKWGYNGTDQYLSLIHISEPTRLLSISYAVFCLKKKTTK